MSQVSPRKVSSRRERIERPTSLPVRPRACLAFVESLAGSPTWDPATPRPTPDLDPALALDPGFVLGGADSSVSLALQRAARARYWVVRGDREAAGLDRLWRHAVACQTAIRFLAPTAPDCLAGLALVSRLGLWGVAATEPALLEALLATREPAARRALWLGRLGVDEPGIARRLAARWAADPAWEDAVWLLDAPAAHAALGAEPESIRLLQQAHEWAERTPWSLGPDRPAQRHAPPSTVVLRQLVARVQAACPGHFCAPEEPAEIERLTRALAVRLLDTAARSRRDAARDRVLRQIAAGRPLSVPARPVAADGTPPAPPRDPLLDRVIRAWETVHSRLDRAEARVDALMPVTLAPTTPRGGEPSGDRLEALAEFAAGAAHELNNPLAVIAGRAQLLLGRTTDPESLRSLRAVIGQAQRAHRMLRDLIYVARPPQQRVRAALPAESLAACLRDARDDAEARGVSLSLATEGPAVGPRPCDPDALRHLADVLLRNAIEASPRGGTVRVLDRSDDAGLLWQFDDEGPGIDARSAALLFDPFYSGRDAGRGLGLGLPRVARFLERAAGSLRWTRRTSGGTSFQVRMPWPAEAEARAS